MLHSGGGGGGGYYGGGGAYETGGGGGSGYASPSFFEYSNLLYGDYLRDFHMGDGKAIITYISKYSCPTCRYSSQHYSLFFAIFILYRS